ncbi:YidC/Oxa1 family insertase periplasmic-domain containing protein, partial [bacterium]|nr:YidC/Oxa1 family insertase periplasmic-domain containing protein [bacterium]
DNPSEEIVVKTDVFCVTFNTAGAYPIRWQIIDPRFAKASQLDVEERQKKGGPPLQVGQPLPLEMIPEYPGLGSDRDFPLMIVLKETGGRFLESFNWRTYDVEGPKLNASGETVLTFRSPITDEGLQVTKTFRFPPSSYLVSLRVEVNNATDQSRFNFDFSETSQPGLGLIWGPGIGNPYYHDRWDASMYMVAAYTGEDILEKRFGNWQKAQSEGALQESFSGNLKWGAVDSRYLMATLIPDAGTSRVRGVVKRQFVPQRESLRKDMAHPIVAEVYSNPFVLKPGEDRYFDYQIFAGPKKRSLLVQIDEEHDYGLRRIMFHNSIWLIRVLSVFMLDLLGWLHGKTNNYGVSIILLTIIMRLLTQPFTHLGMKSQARVMAEQKRIKPLIDAINEKFKDEPQKRSAETWKTYREHGVNPLGMMKGCVWMLVQLPIFFALYRLLVGAIDLRGESFLWINDLTAPDALFTLPFTLPFIGDKLNILPILMGGSQLIAQRLQSSNVQDPNQKMMVTIMPIMFVFILYNFAAGLSLYWFVSNLWQIVFQIFVNKRVREEAEQKAHRAFEEKQKAREQGEPLQKKTRDGKPGVRERFMGYLEKKAKEAERMKKGK